MHARPRARWLLALLFTTGATGAADADIVVTGTRLPMTSAGLAQNVTVIEQAEIQASHPSGIEDVLSRVTGIYVDQAGSAGGFVSMYLRGAENSHLLILLDGVRLNDPTTTRGSTYDLSAIDVNQIERIEVLRGPASAVYGGEALAGVVHFITRRAAVNGIAGSGYAAAGGDDERSYGACSISATVACRPSLMPVTPRAAKAVTMPPSTSIPFPARCVSRITTATPAEFLLRRSSATARPFRTTVAGHAWPSTVS